MVAGQLPHLHTNLKFLLTDRANRLIDHMGGRDLDPRDRFNRRRGRWRRPRAVILGQLIDQLMETWSGKVVVDVGTGRRNWILLKRGDGGAIGP